MTNTIQVKNNRILVFDVYGVSLGRRLLIDNEHIYYKGYSISIMNIGGGSLTNAASVSTWLSKSEIEYEIKQNKGYKPMWIHKYTGE